MASGVALVDEDRWQWLHRVVAAATSIFLDTQTEFCVAACSALKRCYRDILREVPSRVLFVYPRVEPACLQDRLAGRTSHFMPHSLLKSQLDTLEQPHTDENDVFVINIGKEHNMVQVINSVADVVRMKI